MCVCFQIVMQRVLIIIKDKAKVPIGESVWRKIEVFCYRKLPIIVFSVLENMCIHVRPTVQCDEIKDSQIGVIGRMECFALKNYVKGKRNSLQQQQT